MNSQKIISKGRSICPKHSKSKVSTVSSHIPTIKCHEEVMSKLSSCYSNEDCVGEPASCVQTSYDHRKQKSKNRRKFTDEKIKMVSSKYNTHQSSSVPITSEDKNNFPNSVKSRSVPTIQTQNLEDSVDFIPVKLTSANEHRQRPQKKLKSNVNSKLKPETGKCYRPTWDEILRNNLEVKSSGKSTKILSKKSSKSDDSYDPPNSEYSSPSTPKKKVYRKKSDSLSEQNRPKVVLNLDQHKAEESGCSKPVEPLVTEKLKLIHHVNSSDPIKTLDFLIKELREGLLKQPENNNLQKIILDMEHALLKISNENKSYLNDPYERNERDTERPATNPSQSEALGNNHEKSRNKQLDILHLEQKLENSCRYLQSLCIKEKESRNNYLREKDQLSLQLAESRRLLAVSKSKEKDYEVTIGDLRLKLQEANTKIDQLKQTFQEMETKNALLKEENQAIVSLKESIKRVGVRLKQIASEKEKLQSKLSLKDLEIERLKVLLEVTNTKTNGLIQDNKLLTDKHEFDEKISDDEKDISLISLSTVTSWTNDRPGLICSSQASSSPRHSPSPYNSWQHISSIMQQPPAAVDINKGIADIFQVLKKRSEEMEPLRLDLQNPSSNSSLWSEREAGAKVVYSDGESEGFSS